MIVQGTNLSMIRGDSESIIVKCQENNIDVPFVDGDIVYLTIKDNVYTETKLLQRVVTDFTDGKAIIYINPEDTKNIKFGRKIYDVQLTRKDGKVSTIVPPSEFNILGEVTYE